LKIPEFRIPDFQLGALMATVLLSVGALLAFPEEVKAYLTRRIEKYRPSYGRLEVEEPRTCVFVGTTNPASDGAYLVDEENRRFWPVKVGVIRLDDLMRDRDQLWAEAVHRMKVGEQHWPDPEFEARVFKPEQDQRKVVDPWEDPIVRYLQESQTTRVTSLQVAEHALSIQARDFDAVKAKRIGGIMKKRGWQSKRGNGLNFWVLK
jgi:predicted P-loop ATPase